MKVGDTEVELWLEASGGRSFYIFITSKRNGKRDSKEWQTPVFKWFVEEWPKDGEKAIRFTNTVTEKTFNEAMRHSRRHADMMERESRRKRG